MNEAFKEALGLLLKDLRVKRGLTLEQVRDLTAEIDWPISRSRLSALERGSLELKASDIYPLSRVYGCAVADLISEAIVAHSRKRFAKKLSAEELFEEGKRLFDEGQALKAAWAFDEAGRRAAEDANLRQLALVSAAHAYERTGANGLALRRAEDSLNIADPDSENQVKGFAKASQLLLKLGQHGRARIYDSLVAQALERNLKPELVAHLCTSRAKVQAGFGNIAEAVALIQRAAKLFRKIGQYDFAAKSTAATAMFLARGKQSPKIALRHARDALALLREETQVESRLYVLICVGETLLHNGQDVAAQKHLANAASLAIKHHYDQEADWALELLEGLAKRSGRKSELTRIRRKRQALVILNDGGAPRGSGIGRHS